MTDNLKHIEEFWNNNLCGSHFVDARYPSEAFFERYRRFRYKKEHHLNNIIDWESAINKNVLEVGTGVGADGVRWAKYAKFYVGIDLTDEAVSATYHHLKLLRLRGNILKGDTELLPFNANSFDIVYTHGVLHHAPCIEKALKEIYRVLRVGGVLIIMLYCKDSFNYWLRIQLYFRIRFLLEFLKYKLRVEAIDPWKSHIRNYQNLGWSYFSWNNWYHRCTDGPNCPIANIYHKHEIVDMVQNAGFIVDYMRKAHFPMGAKFPRIEKILAKYIGFYQFVWANKK